MGSIRFFVIYLVAIFGVLHAQDNSAVIQQYYSNITKAEKNQEWFKVIYFSKALLKNHPQNVFAVDLNFYLAKAYFHINELDLSDQFFSKYLSKEFSPKYYEEAIGYKFKIAKKYYEGVKKPIFGARKMPKIISGKEDALKLFDEVLNALPNSDMAIESMFYKGKIHAYIEEYKESIEAFQTIIRKYSKHDLAIESYLQIGKVYLMQADPRHQDPNLIDMFEINLRKFEEAFPKEERIQEALEDFSKIQEIYAQGLYEVGFFYEKTKKKDAAKMYYEKIVSSFPASKSAKMSQERLNKIDNDEKR